MGGIPTRFLNTSNTLTEFVLDLKLGHEVKVCYTNLQWPHFGGGLPDDEQKSYLYVFNLIITII